MQNCTNCYTIRFNNWRFAVIFILITNFGYSQPPNNCIFSAIDITPMVDGISSTNRFDCASYTFTGATRDNVNGNNTPCDAGPDYRDVWFTFTISGSSPGVWIDAYTGGMDIVSAVYSGTPAGNCGPINNITGLTYIDCSDYGFGGPLDMSNCTTPLHSRIDVSSFPPGTYYYRVWEWNGGAPPAETFRICVEDATSDGVTSDPCPAGPTIAITPCQNTSITETYLNLSNAGMTGNACNTNPNEPQLAVGAAGNYQDNCMGTLWTGLGYVNNVMNNSAIYGFNINASPGCDPQVSLTFDNMEYGGTPGNVAQIQVVNGPCVGGSGAVMLGTTDDPCFYMQPTSGTLPSGNYFIIVDGQDGQLVEYDLTIDIDYTPGCENPTPLACTLPVELINFEARLNIQGDQKEVLVSWQTASEMNCDRFIVEHSRDGTNYNDIAVVKAAGNSSSLKEYSYDHLRPEYGMHYYRLDQVDFDGNSKYSEVRTVNINNGLAIQVFPNPSSGKITISTNSKIKSVLLTDLTGSKVKGLELDSPSMMLEMDNTALHAGIYLLQVNTEDNKTAVTRITIK